jgi:hypothetical protein
MKSQMFGRSVLPVLVALAGLAGTQAASAQRNTPPDRELRSARESVVIPADTVIKVRLNDRLNSRDARVGDRFTAVVDDGDRSGFPDGTRFEGVVSEAQKSGDNRPGVIDMDFRQAILPDGRKLPINGQLASLSEEDVRRSADGRILSRRGGSSSKFDPKWVGYGAAGGAVLGTIFGSNFLKGALLGGVGGAIYGYLNRDKGKGEFRDVTLDEGTTFGVRLADRVAFQDGTNYRYSYRPGRDNPNERVAGRRETFRYGTPTVRLNGRDLRFTDLQPMMLNGVLYVPLRPIAQEANLRFTHERGDDNFTLQTADGPVRGTVGEVDLDGRGTRNADDTLTNAPLSVNGEIYVPVSFLSRVGDLRANWSRQDLRLDLDSSTR